MRAADACSYRLPPIGGGPRGPTVGPPNSIAGSSRSNGFVFAARAVEFDAWCVASEDDEGSLP